MASHRKPISIGTGRGARVGNWLRMMTLKSQLPRPNSTTTACKLCAALAASNLPTAAERRLPGSDAFTGDPEICDACLRYDYSRRGPRSAAELFAITSGWWLAFIVAAFVTLQRHGPVLHLLARLPALPRVLVSFLLVMCLAAAPCIFLVWFLVRVAWWSWMRATRDQVQRELEANHAIDADRFYWLAVWGSLTGHKRYERRMLKKAKALGLANQNTRF